MTTKPQFIWVALLTLATLVWTSCESPLPGEPEFDNPLDPDSPTNVYVPPETSILSGPADGEVVNDHTVMFILGGNEHVIEWAYSLNGSDTSAWQTDSLLTLEYLDEGLQELSVWGRYATGDEDDSPATRSFTVDAITGPALWLSPRSLSVAAGEDITLSLKGEDLVDMLAFRARVAYDNTLLEFSAVALLDQSTSFLKQHGGDVIAIIDTLESSGIIDLNILLAGGTVAGASGSGALLTVTFSSLKSGSGEILLLDQSAIISTNLVSNELVAASRLGSVIVVAP